MTTLTITFNHKEFRHKIMTLSLTKRASLVFISSLLLLGCGGVKPYKAPVTQGVVITQQMLDDLQPGLHKDQVRQLLGPNYGENPFKDNHWEYIYSSTDDQLHTHAVKHIVINFDQDGYVTDWKQVN
ncbi:outer membrane protein assembly factor BamE [Thiomicrospira sp.]|uniref:outer membrane protein assembly factor BamE n=1 Tax=Thiomicrospira sp. TaxID=935 RepID=UPI002F933F29